jgi:hypothetical protein
MIRYIRLPIASTPTHCLGDCPQLNQKSIPTWCRCFGMLERDERGFLRATGCVEAEAEYDEAISNALTELTYGHP